MNFWGTFFVVAITMLLSSLFTAVFIVAGIEYICDKKTGSKKNEKKNSNSNSDNNTTN